LPFLQNFKRLTQSLTTDEGVVVRNAENYDTDLAIGDCSRTGIKAYCALNKVKFYHVTENFTVDILHDLAEGFCDTVMLCVLDYFVNVLKLFDFETLNFRMDMFNYGPVVSNKPPLLSGNRFENTKLKMTGSEKLTFVHLLGIMIGDLVPVGDAYWELYLSLRKVIDIAMSPVVSVDTPRALRAHVKAMLELYLSLNATHALKPNAHFLTHYPVCMEKCGPLRNMSCFRDEAKHRQLKAAATATPSRRNIAFTVAVKHHLNLSFRFKANVSILPQTESGSGHIENLEKNENFFLFCDSLPLSYHLSGCKCYVTNWVSYKGTRYSPSMLLLVGFDECSLPVFAEIKLVAIHSEQILFICQNMRTVGFEEHVHGYQVVHNSKWTCYTVDSLVRPKPLFPHKTIRGDLIVILM